MQPADCPPLALRAFGRDPLAATRAVRSATLALVEGLDPEDLMLQSMPQASPAKWHLAHTTWFFETFVLRPHRPRYRSPDDRYTALFNSYYVAVGPAHDRPARGVLSRPRLSQVLRYREHVDAELDAMLATGDVPPAVLAVIELGLHHEQQHQELLLTDLLHAFAANPLAPAYRAVAASASQRAAAQSWHGHEGGAVAIGHDGQGFAFDHEGPRHEVLLRPFALAGRAVTAGEFLAFVQDGGYGRAPLWQSLGYDTARAQQWQAPLHWRLLDDGWQQMTLAGLRPLDLQAPVAHVSWFEADAYARWAGARLPSEAEWECMAAAHDPAIGNYVESGALQPRAHAGDGALAQLFGDVWEWTGSAYLGYPGYRPPAGALGEYNGKFMVNQFVLRGGSCATPASHMRASYRNFFDPAARWQFSGIRLARDA